MISNGIAAQAIGLSRPQPSREQQELRANVRDLIDAIKQGDLDAAKEAFAKINDAEGGKAKEDAKTPLDKLLAAIGEALEAGDIEAARQALEEFESARFKDRLPAVGRLEEALLPDDTRNAFIDLIKALRSDDLGGAKDAYSALLALAEDDEAEEAASRFDEFLQVVGAALEKDDLEAAKDALEELSQDNPLGRTLDLTA